MKNPKRQKKNSMKTWRKFQQSEGFWERRIIEMQEKPTSTVALLVSNNIKMMMIKAKFEQKQQEDIILMINYLQFSFSFFIKTEFSSISSLQKNFSFLFSFSFFTLASRSAKS